MTTLGLALISGFLEALRASGSSANTRTRSRAQIFFSGLAQRVSDRLSVDQLKKPEIYSALPQWDARVYLSQFQRGCEMRLPRDLRQRHYYTVDHAGAQLGYSRAGSYRAAERGDIPVERDGKFLLVPKRKWDRIVRRLLREERTTNSGPAAEARKSPGGVSGD